MNPEERAFAFGRKVINLPTGTRPVWHNIEPDVAREIRAAAEEMRERCAALAAEKWNCGGSVVAKAIRELKP